MLIADGLKVQPPRAVLALAVGLLLFAFSRIAGAALQVVVPGWSNGTQNAFGKFVLPKIQDNAFVIQSVDAWLRKLAHTGHTCQRTGFHESPSAMSIVREKQSSAMIEDASPMATLNGGCISLIGSSSCLALMDVHPFPWVHSLEDYLAEDIMDHIAQLGAAYNGLSHEKAADVASALNNSMLFSYISAFERIGADDRMPHDATAKRSARATLSAIRTDTFRRSVPVLVVLGRDIASPVHLACRHGAAIVTPMKQILVDWAAAAHKNNIYDPSGDSMKHAVEQGVLDAWLYGYRIDGEVHMVLVIDMANPMDVHYDLLEAAKGTHTNDQLDKEKSSNAKVHNSGGRLADAHVNSYSQLRQGYQAVGLLLRSLLKP